MTRWNVAEVDRFAGMTSRAGFLDCPGDDGHGLALALGNEVFSVLDFAQSGGTVGEHIQNSGGESTEFFLAGKIEEPVAQADAGPQYAFGGPFFEVSGDDVHAVAVSLS